MDFPWVTVEHLASHILGSHGETVVRADWERLYQHPIYFVETFVDPTRFRGTCYRAANWIRLGETTGRGKDDPPIVPTDQSKRSWATH